MKLSFFSNVTFLLIAAMAGGALSAAPRSSVEDWACADEASRILNQIRSTASRLAIQTDTLESYTRGGLSWESHAGRLNMARESINEIGQLLQQLQEIRNDSAPWQRRAVDSVAPIAESLANRTEAAIDHLNWNRQYLWAPVYADHLKAMAEHASQMKKNVDVHLELADTANKLEDLRTQAAKAGS